MNPPDRPAPELVCHQCGQPDARAVGDEVLCASCCHERGSCGAVRETDDPRHQPPVPNPEAGA